MDRCSGCSQERGCRVCGQYFGWVVAAGFPRVILKSDSEPAILALKRSAAAKLRSEHGIEVQMEESPVADSQANGVAERAIGVAVPATPVVGERRKADEQLDPILASELDQVNRESSLVWSHRVFYQ